MEAVLIDTSILVGRMRRQSAAFKASERIVDLRPVVCDVILAEILAGSRDRAEFDRNYLELTTKFHVLPFTMEVSVRFRAILSSISPQHQVHLADHLIAATAIAHDVPLLTLNTKHFKGIKGLRLA